MTHTIRRPERGFTLVEMAVVITLVSSFAAFAMSLAQKKIEQNKTEITKKRMEYIQLTLENYVRRYGRLPCPADATQGFTSATFGIEASTGTPPTACSDASNLERRTSTGTASNNSFYEIYAGAVPVYTLQLPLRYTMDGWGNRFTYAVTEALVNAATFGDPMTTDTSLQGQIIVSNMVNTSSLCPNSTSSDGNGMSGCYYNNVGDSSNSAAAFVLVSHGANGYGAWPGAGGSRAIQTGLETAEELANRNGGVNANIGLYYQAVFSGTFDDIAIYDRKYTLPTPCTANCP